MPTRITAAQAERLIDQRVMRALDRDPRYIHAADAEEQMVAEDAITAEVVAEIERKFAIYD